MRVKIVYLNCHENHTHKYRWAIIDYLQKDAKHKKILSCENEEGSFWYNIAHIINPTNPVYVATDKRQRLLGYMLFNRKPDNKNDREDYLELEIMEVLKPYRGKGVGKAMVDWVKSTLKKARVKEISVESLSGTDDFWEKMGFHGNPRSARCQWLLTIDTAKKHRVKKVIASAEAVPPGSSAASRCGTCASPSP